MLDNCRKFFSSRELHGRWSASVLNDLKEIAQRTNPVGLDPLIIHYRHFRTRFHTGTSAIYTNMLSPLQSRLFQDACATLEPHVIERRQPFFDIMASCQPALLEIPFDDPEKSPTALNLQEISKADICLDKSGNVFGLSNASAPQQPTNEPGDERSALDMLEDAVIQFDTCATRKTFSKISTAKAIQFLHQTRQGGSSLRPRDGYDVHNIILTGFLEGLDF